MTVLAKIQKIVSMWNSGSPNDDEVLQELGLLEDELSTITDRDAVLELLNDLRRYANGEYKEADLSDNEHDLRIHLEYENRIWAIMQGLRTSNSNHLPAHKRRQS